VYAGSYRRVATTTDGVNWYDASSGLSPDCTVYDIAVNPVTPTVVYAALRRGPADQMGVYRSVNAGASWARASVGITDTNITAIAVDLHEPTVIYAATGGGTLFRSSNGGDSWSWSGPGIVVQSQWPGIWDIEADPHTPGVVYLAQQTDGQYPGGVYKSPDYGQTWQRIWEANSGTVVVDPVQPGVLIADDWGNSLYRSSDGGATWEAYDAGAFASSRYVMDLAIGPVTGGWRLYAGTSMKSVWQRDLYTSVFLPTVLKSP